MSQKKPSSVIQADENNKTRKLFVAALLIKIKQLAPAAKARLINFDHACESCIEIAGEGKGNAVEIKSIYQHRFYHAGRGPIVGFKASVVPDWELRQAGRHNPLGEQFRTVVYKTERRTSLTDGFQIESEARFISRILKLSVAQNRFNVMRRERGKAERSTLNEQALNEQAMHEAGITDPERRGFSFKPSAKPGVVDVRIEVEMSIKEAVRLHSFLHLG